MPLSSGFKRHVQCKVRHIFYLSYYFLKHLAEFEHAERKIPPTMAKLASRGSLEGILKFPGEITKRNPFPSWQLDVSPRDEPNRLSFVKRGGETADHLAGALLINYCILHTIQCLDFFSALFSLRLHEYRDCHASDHSTRCGF